MPDQHGRDEQRRTADTGKAMGNDAFPAFNSASARSTASSIALIFWNAAIGHRASDQLDPNLPADLILPG